MSPARSSLLVLPRRSFSARQKENARRGSLLLSFCSLVRFALFRISFLASRRRSPVAVCSGLWTRQDKTRQDKTRSRSVSVRRSKQRQRQRRREPGPEEADLAGNRQSPTRRNAKTAALEAAPEGTPTHTPASCVLAASRQRPLASRSAQLL